MTVRLNEVRNPISTHVDVMNQRRTLVIMEGNLVPGQSCPTSEIAPWTEAVGFILEESLEHGSQMLRKQ